MARYKLMVNVETKSPAASVAEQNALYDSLKRDLVSGETPRVGGTRVFIDGLARVPRWPSTYPWGFLAGVWCLFAFLGGDTTWGWAYLAIFVLFMGDAAWTYKKGTNWKVD